MTTGPVFELVEGQMICRLKGEPDGVRFFTPAQAAARFRRDRRYLDVCLALGMPGIVIQEGGDHAH